LDCGTEEAKDEPEISKEFLHSNQSIYDILKNKVSHSKFQIVGGAEHSYMDFRKRIPEMFSYLLS
jgi:enterochelin esterase-like enzyme